KAAPPPAGRATLCGAVECVARVRRLDRVSPYRCWSLEFLWSSELGFWSFSRDANDRPRKFCLSKLSAAAERNPHLLRYLLELRQLRRAGRHHRAIAPHLHARMRQSALAARPPRRRYARPALPGMPPANARRPSFR